MSLDREWRFVYVNRHFEPYWRRPVEELIGQSIWDLYPELLGTELETGFRKAMAGGEPVCFEAPGASTGRWYRVSAYPSVAGLTVFGVDLTESRRSEAELRQARTEAEAANHIKDQFLATLSW